MLEVFDRKTRLRTAILQNAFAVKEQKPLNALRYLSFSLPYDDPKNEYCQPFHYVRLDGGQMYRIMDDGMARSETGDYTYNCEHVIATLMDKVMFGYHIVGNIGVYTADCINHLLEKQEEKNWVLGECDFRHQFEYGWEQENLLSALFSIPKGFTDSYIWTFDTSAYPWVVNLKRLAISDKPKLYIRNSHNLLNISRERTRTTVCTRLYPLGYGEGVNQLGIAEVNDGVPYLQSPKEYIDKFGVIERVWVDRRYENAESLKAAAQAMLNELQEPVVAYQASMADLVYAAEDASVEPGATVRLIDTETGTDLTTFLTEINVTYGDVQSSTITIANRSTDIASTVADLADRQRIEMTYSQGATQVYSQSLQENADSENGLVMDFSIPNEMRIINKVICKVRMESFRTYSKTTSTTDSESRTSDDGGQISDTTESVKKVVDSTYDGGSYTTTSYGGGGGSKTIESMQGLGDDDTGLPFAKTGSVSAAYHLHKIHPPKHTHTVVLEKHTHDVPIPAHNHKFEIPKHKHDIEIEAHSHKFKIPGHNHNIEAGIFRCGSPKSFRVLVNGKVKAIISKSSEEIDLTEYLIDEGTGKIRRGDWQSLEIVPDDLAYIKVSLMVQGFVQSRGDAVV